MFQYQKILFIFLALFLSASAEKVEIYFDWLPDAVGMDNFEKPEEGVSLHYAIRSALEQRGYSVNNWDRKAHLPWLLSWKKIKSWEQFQHFLGIGLTRKEALDSDTAYLVLSGIGLYLRDLNLGRIQKEKLLLFIWEPPTVQPQAWNPNIWKCCHRIYTWNDDLVDGVRFFKFHLPFMTPRIQNLVPYDERKFLTLIASRLSSKHPNQIYSERQKLIRFFEARPDEQFDLFGRHWEKRQFRSWQGAIPDKMAVLKQYRFAIAYENSLETGYITEKLWDCFAAGVVPIYWGAPNITDVVPSDCFIDRRRFACDEDLLAFLKVMPEEAWQGYVDRAEKFLQSKTASLFSMEAFAELLGNAVKPL